ncbi:MAG: pyruvate-formate lyase-activating enzyme [Myxococcota bacterium]
MGFDAWVGEAAKPIAPWRVLGRSITGVVSWNVNDTCNYRCSYCTQRFMPERTFKQEEIDRTVASFAQLPGAWEIKLSGGEPFVQPGIVALTRGLVAHGHVVSVQTNFSAPEARLQAFLQATRGALAVFSASLHREYATPEQFIQRFEIVRPYLSEGLRFNVTCVGLPGELEQLRDEVAPRFLAAGIPFKVQPEKVRGYVRDYSERDRALLLELGGHNHTGKIQNDFQGRLCHAGLQYLVVQSDGQAFRCYPARRVGGRYARLGSLQEGLTLMDRARACPYTYCNCTVPIERGMMRA